MPAYLLRADQCPAIPVPSVLIDPSDEIPTTAGTVTAGASGPGSLSSPFNGNACRADNAGRYGGGLAHCVKEGLDLSMSGLTCTISAGHLGVDAGVTIPSAITLAIPNNIYSASDLTTRVWVWLSYTGDPIAVTSSTAAPGVLYACLGSIRTLAGAYVDIDYSGRTELRGGTLYRQTGDVGMPADTPSAKLQLMHRTQGGVYWWDGTRYWSVAPTGVVPERIVTGDLFVIPTNYQMQVFKKLRIDGKLRVDGRLRVVD